jgi:predicted PurR-regulated permease PerM
MPEGAGEGGGGPVVLGPLPRAFVAAGLVFFLVAGLRIGAPVIVPVIEALFVCFVLNAVAKAIRRLPAVGPLIPWWLALVIAALIALACGAWAVQSMVKAGAAIGPQALGMRETVDPLVDRVAGLFGLSSQDLLNRVVDQLGLEAALRYVAAATVATINHFGIVAIYVGFLLVDQQFLDAKLRALIRDDARRARVDAVLADVSRGIQAYLWVMTFVSALTAVLCYAVMRAAGMDFAGFWAVAIFFLNFIPTIGSILGTLLPAAVAVVQLQDPLSALAVLVAISAIQFAIGNILLPRLAGGTLNISLGVTIFSLFFWGALWGVTGMFVAMPLTATLIIAFSHFEATRPVAILLSRTGELGLPGAGRGGR